MAADDWLEHAVKLSNSWVFPAVALSSLAAHLILVFFSGIRRRKAYGVSRFFVWLAYQVNNWAPTYVLGNLYIDTTPHEKQLYAFWVPFLLLHLARPDNVSAYSMDDTSGRVMLFVPLQSFGAVTILYRYIHMDTTAGTLRPASWIMLSLAIFKYAESAMALSRGDLNSIRSSFKRTSRETEGHSVEDDEGLLLVAHDHLDICKGAFGDHPVDMDIRQQAEEFGWKTMCKVVEMELSLMYDLMYTKAAMVHTWGGYGIRVVSPVLTVVALSLFWLRYREEGLQSRDVDISYILLGTTLVLDVAWLLRAIGSTWAHAFFQGTRWHWVKHAVICGGRWKRIRRLVVSLELLRDKEPSSYRVWSGPIGQHNLLRDFRDTERWSSKLAKSIRLEESWNEHCYSGPGVGLDLSREVAVRDVLFERIWSLILVPAHDPMAQPPIGHQRRRDLDQALSFDPQIGEVVIIWHIATVVFLCHAKEDTPASEWPAEVEEVIRAVSDYMLFLIAIRPSMIPGLKLRSLYEATRAALNALWSDMPTSPTSGVDEKKLVLILRDKVVTLHEWSLTLSDGARCAFTMLQRVNAAGWMWPSNIPWPDLQVMKKLGDLRPELFQTSYLTMADMLDLIFDVWVRLLIYASIRCSRDSHAKQLAQGGELTTIIWILAQHSGMYPKRQA
ncbi:hypothetical protein ACQ4PT_030692 [Festuca glaucescens]